MNEPEQDINLASTKGRPSVDEEEAQTYLDALALKAQFCDDKQLAEALLRVVSTAARIVEEDREDPPVRRAAVSGFHINAWNKIHEWDAYTENYSLDDIRWLPTFTASDAIAPEGAVAEPLGRPAAPVELHTVSRGRASDSAPPPDPAPSNGQTTGEPIVLRRGTVMSLLVVLLSTGLLIESVAWGLFSMYLGFAAFCVANFAAYQVREPNLILRPDVALLGLVASLGLAVMALVGAL